LREKDVVGKLAHELLRRDLDWAITRHKDQIRDAVKATVPPRGRKKTRLTDVVAEMDRQYGVRKHRHERCQPAERLTGQTRMSERLRTVASRYRGEYRNLDPDSFAIHGKTRLFLDGGRLYVCRPNKPVVTFHARGCNSYSKIADALVSMVPVKVLTKAVQRGASIVFDVERLTTIVTYPNVMVTRHPWGER
jgi:hypothetical protein